ncbi:MAG TPA: DUF1295 domain-containing protein [Candidatus Saccharimonadales bacterium]|nr:DUF1295 domain-containing protein [Candidatus Saccharimonadales bacterium]
MLSILFFGLLVSLIINMLMFLIAFRWQSDKLTDISYALSFLALDFLGIIVSKSHNIFSVVLFLLPGVWSVRLGGFLLNRVIKAGKDRRFDGIRENFKRFANFWFGQAVTAWVLMIPVLIMQTRTGHFSVIGVIGLVMWAGGFLYEALADYQKYVFKQNPANKGKWIAAGLWGYSRHPNYLGEITVWLGIYIYCFQGLDSLEKIIGLISPVFIYVLLRYVSGVPVLEKSADKRWGNSDAYKSYKQKTGLLLPRPGAAQTK